MTTPAPTSLLKHQHEGIEFLLARRSGLLAFEQGLGKTLVAIEGFLRLRAKGEAEAMVVLCPNSLKKNWVAEVEKFAPGLSTCIIGGGRQQRRLAMLRTKELVVVVNYETARNEITAVRELLGRRRTVLVLDESHSVKNYRSLTSIAAQHFGPCSDFRWLLSGTPITNSPVDIYPQLCLAAGGQPFGSFAAFEARYGGGDAGEVHKQLTEKIRPYVLRRTKAECLDLPDKTFVDVMVQLPPWQMKLYAAMRDDLAAEVEGMTPEEFKQFAPTALTRLLRLSQLASNPRLLVPDDKRVPGKVAELDRILEEIAGENGHKVILWSYYVQTIRMLAERYANYGTAILSGSTPAEDRQGIAARFQTDPSLKVLVANPAAAGTGFTLTAATYSIYETLTWRYDYYAQSQDRNHRIGQHNPVTYIRLIADGTVEQAVAEALARKATIATEILGDEDSPPRSSEMTREFFCEILRTGRLPGSTATAS